MRSGRATAVREAEAHRPKSWPSSRTRRCGYVVARRSRRRDRLRRGAPRAARADPRAADTRRFPTARLRRPRGARASRVRGASWRRRRGRRRPRVRDGVIDRILFFACRRTRSRARARALERFVADDVDVVVLANAPRARRAAASRGTRDRRSRRDAERARAPARTRWRAACDPTRRASHRRCKAPDDVRRAAARPREHPPTRARAP